MFLLKVIYLDTEKLVISGVNLAKTVFVMVDLKSDFFNSFSWKTPDQYNDIGEWCIKIPTRVMKIKKIFEFLIKN